MKKRDLKTGVRRWRGLALAWAAFVLIAAVLFAERAGVGYTGTDFDDAMLDRSEARTAEQAAATLPESCLVLFDSAQDGVSEAREQFERILLDMKIGARWVDTASTDESDIPSFSDYDRIVVLMPALDPIAERIQALSDWVRQGGNLVVGMTLERTEALDALAPTLGIEDAGSLVTAESIVPDADFMAGGGQRYELSDPFESSLSVTLAPEARVRAATGDAGVPLIWSYDTGEGRAAVCNIGVYDKVLRGFYACAISLSREACVWPVINSAVFYLDDFPSPVPSGDGVYIERDYGLSIADFYAKVWWPDLTRLSMRYGLRYTGAMIENYDDDTEGPLVWQSDPGQFRYYGGLLLRQGGELGYHGYNHQPLCLPDTDYGTLYSYNTWASVEAVEESLRQLAAFQSEVLPGAECSVYVPPSNILSQQARAAIGADLPEIRTIASTYFDDDAGFAYTQEFEVAEDGVVEQPRIVSGSMAGDTYMRLAAASELNMHFVSTHFMHPDDLLDPDRGAQEGWEAYKSGLEDYLDWLEDAVPEIRKQTGTECSAAIQRFAGVTAQCSSDADAWTLSLDGFEDEAWLLLRANDGVPGSVEGGTVENVAGDLYLVHATSSEVRIERTEAAL